MDDNAKQIYIIGAGGFGREVFETIIEINKASAQGDVYRVEGFIDDNESIHGTEINGVPVTGSVEYLRGLAGGAGADVTTTDNDVAAAVADGVAQNKKPRAVIAVGAPKIKKTIAEKLEGFVTWETLIHPTAVVSQFSEIGEGSILQAFTVMGPNAQVGDHFCLNIGSTIAHDVVVENHVSIMGHCDVTGCVHLKECAYVATSVSVVPGVVIGEGAFVGAGSVVIRDVEAGSTSFGNPARRVR